MEQVKEMLYTELAQLAEANNLPPKPEDQAEIKEWAYETVSKLPFDESMKSMYRKLLSGRADPEKLMAGLAQQAKPNRRQRRQQNNAKVQRVRRR